MKIFKINNNQSFKSNKLHPKDLAYKKTLQQGLKESFSKKTHKITTAIATTLKAIFKISFFLNIIIYIFN